MTGSMFAPTRIRITPGEYRLESLGKTLAPVGEVRVKRTRDVLGHPAQFVLVAYLAAIVFGTALLMLPMSTRNGETTSVVDALFTATSAVSVTGLAVVDTATHWTVAGQVIILLLIQVGGLGIMTLATLFALLFFRRISLRARQAAAVETKSLSLEDFKGILRRILVFALLIQAIAAVVLVWRLASFHSESLFSATFNGIFLAISSFNNAGFAPYSRNLEHLIGDPWILLVISLAVILGGLGFPVVIELVRKWRTPRRWSILTRVTMVMTGSLLVLGTAAFWFAEHDHVATLASLGAPQQLVASFFTSTMTRTAGFNAISQDELQPESLLLTNVFMFIGGGSAGTAGGIKVTTIGLLLFVVWAEMRGRSDASIGNRRISSAAQRQALSIVTLGAAIVAIFTFVIMAVTTFTFEQVLFEVTSAFGTVGLSLGITPDLSDPAKVLMAVLMLIGRIGPLTLAVALAARSKVSLVRLPEERMIVG